MFANILILLVICATPLACLAQGFAGLAADARGHALPRPDYRMRFPADHGPHWDFRIEWWYFTANLTGGDGREYGVQWTLFRTALSPEGGAGWLDPQIWMGHAAVTSADDHRHAERLARGGIGQAGVVATPFSAWIDNWSMKSADGAGIGHLTLIARDSDFGFSLRLASEGPLVLHGQHGYSLKSRKGQASHYYSQPFYRVEGTLELDGNTVTVTGNGWLDREWSSQPLAEDQEGWDWFALGFDTGSKLMVYRLREPGDDWIPGTWISADGSMRFVSPGEIGLFPMEEVLVAGRKIPVRWRLEYPGEGIGIEVSALNARAWMDTTVPYWEGPVRVSGSHAGRGYLEMTGYGNGS